MALTRAHASPKDLISATKVAVGVMRIVKTLQVLAGVFAFGAVLLIIIKGQSVLVVALVGTSHAALLWAAAVTLTSLNRIIQVVEWTALRGTKANEPLDPPRT